MNEQLLTLGLSQKEAKLYLDLISTGSSSAHSAAKRTGFPRATVYFLLDELENKKLIRRKKKGGTHFFTPSNPEQLTQLVAQEQRKLLDKKKAAAQLVKSLTPLIKQREQGAPSVEFFEGKKEVEAFLYRATDLWIDSVQESDQTYWGYQDPAIMEQYHAWVSYYWKKKPVNQKVKIFSSEFGREEGKKVPNRKIRLLPNSHSFESNTWVFGAYVVVVASKNEPHYAFQIKDKILAANLQGIFSMLWDATNHQPTR